MQKKFVDLFLRYPQHERLTGEARFAHTVITVYAVLADAIITWVAGTVVKVDFTVGACRQILLCNIITRQMATVKMAD